MNYRIRNIIGIIILIISLIGIGFTMYNTIIFEKNKINMKATISNIKSLNNNYLAEIKYKVNNNIYVKNIIIKNNSNYKKNSYINIFYNQENPNQFECHLDKKIYFKELILIFSLILLTISIIMLIIIPKYSEYEFSSTISKKDLNISSILLGICIIGTITLHYLNNKEIIISKSLNICKWYLLIIGIFLLLSIISSTLTSRKLNGNIRWRN